MHFRREMTVARHVRLSSNIYIYIYIYTENSVRFLSPFELFGQQLAAGNHLHHPNNDKPFSIWSKWIGQTQSIRVRMSLPQNQRPVSDGQAASPVKQGTKHARSLGCRLPYMANICRNGQVCDKGHPRCHDVSTHCIGSSRNWTGLGFCMHLTVLTEQWRSSRR
jgi:hypothetical protein